MAYGTAYRRALQRSRRRHACRPGVECLEQRRVPATFLVDSLADTPAVDLATGGDADGAVGLRGAVMAANARPGPDLIVLPAGKFVLFGAAADDDGAAVGDLDIHGPLTIVGQGRDLTRITTSELDRPFEVFEGPLDLQDIDLFVPDLIDRGPVVQVPNDPFLPLAPEPSAPPLPGLPIGDLGAVVDAVARGLFPPTAQVRTNEPLSSQAPLPPVSFAERNETPEEDLRARFGVGGPDHGTQSGANEIVVRTHQAFWRNPGIQPVIFRDAEEAAPQAPVPDKAGPAATPARMPERPVSPESAPADAVSEDRLIEIKSGDGHGGGPLVVPAALALGEIRRRRRFSDRSRRRGTA